MVENSFGRCVSKRKSAKLSKGSRSSGYRAYLYMSERKKAFFILRTAQAYNLSGSVRHERGGSNCMVPMAGDVSLTEVAENNSFSRSTSDWPIGTKCDADDFAKAFGIGNTI